MTTFQPSTRGHMIRKSYKGTPDDAWVVPKRYGVIGGLLGPNLPQLRNITWHPETLRWYELIRLSDIAQIYTDVEWQSLVKTALLYNAIFSGEIEDGKPLPTRERQTFQVELRQQEAALLLSPEARKRMKVVFVEPSHEQKEQAVDDFRSSWDSLMTDLEVTYG